MSKWWNFYKASFSGLKSEIWILALITLINRAGSMVIPFLSLYLTQDKGFNLTTAGLILSSYGVGSIAGNYIGGILSDKIGTYKVQVFSLLSTACCFIVLSRMDTIYEISAMIVLTAICADTFRPASMAAVGEHSRKENRSRAIGLIRLAINIGFTLGPAVAGWLAYAYSYQHLFWVDAITCALACIVLMLYLKPKKSIESKEESTDIKISILKDRSFVLFIVSCFLSSVIFMQLFYALPVYLKEIGGLSESDIGTLLGFNGLVIVLLEMPLLHALRKQSNVIRWIALGVFSVGISYSLLVFTGNTILFYIMMLILTLGEMLSFPLSTTWTLNRTSESNRGKYMGIYGIAFSVAHIVGPSTGLYIANLHGWNNLWILLAAIAIVNALFLHFVIRE